jgi:hypothetical protein
MKGKCLRHLKNIKTPQLFEQLTIWKIHACKYKSVTYELLFQTARASNALICMQCLTCKSAYKAKVDNSKPTNEYYFKQATQIMSLKGIDSTATSYLVLFFDVFELNKTWMFFSQRILFCN